MHELVDRPQVSIITPAYNAESYLREAVESVLAQSFSDFELLIVDDGSTDGTLQLARTLGAADPRVRVFPSSCNQGQPTARNEALHQARGRFFALLDSDDAWEPNYLAEQLSVFRQSDDVAVVTANATNVGGVLDGKTFWPVTSGTSRLTLLDIIEHEDSVCIMSVFRREVFETIGGFDPKRRGNEDYHFWLRAARAGFVIVRNAKPLGRYRRRPDSESANERRMLRGVITTFKEIEQMCAELPAERAAVRRQISVFRKRLLRAEVRACFQRFRLVQWLQREQGGGFFRMSG